MKIIADENIPFVAECFSSIGEVITISGRDMRPEVVSNADIVLVRSITKVNSKFLRNSKVRFVATATIGFDHIDTEYLSQNNIGFAYAPGSNANSVAEYIVAAQLEIGRKHSFELEGKSIGIIGVGNVGSKVAKKCAALGMKTYLNDPPLQRQTKDPKYLPIEELFGCDFITLHTPLNFEGQDKTYHLADDKFFASLKPDCVFINTSRGAVHDTTALKTAIQNKKLRSVILDVWENEPAIDTELLEMVDIGTPHIAGYSLDGKIAGMIMIYKAACEYFKLEAKYDTEDFLPETETSEIRIEEVEGDVQQILHRIVQQVYVINRDDFNTREIAMIPEDEKGKLFDDLRKNYPVRREFQNTQVVLEKPSDSLSAKLSGIGFRV